MTPRLRRGASAGILLAGAVALSGCSGSGQHEAADATYGGLPTFLPPDPVKADRVLDGSAAKPALTTQGDAVRVTLTDATLRAAVSGPEVPGEGLPYVAPSTTCTWRVTLSAATSAVPIRATDFTSIDHLGTIYRPTFVKGQPLPPATLAPGKTVTFEIRATMNSGEGLMRWAPQGRIVASWDFEVEND